MICQDAQFCNVQRLSKVVNKKAQGHVFCEPAAVDEGFEQMKAYTGM